jgi:hypothetical protein
MTGEERIRAAVLSAIRNADTSAADNEMTVAVTIITTAQTAAACALLAELRAPREPGESERTAAWKEWAAKELAGQTSVSSLSIWDAGWDAHAAASKARRP